MSFLTWLNWFVARRLPSTGRRRRRARSRWNGIPLRLEALETRLTPTLSIFGLTPTISTLAGNVPITITGTDLNTVTSVTFGTTEATNLLHNPDGSLTVTCPADATREIVDVAVSDGVTSDQLFSAFTYTSYPFVTDISPTSGPASGGTSVTLTGGNFTTATEVWFGPTAVSTFTVTSDSQLTVASPAASYGSAQVYVVDASSNFDGSPALFTYTAAAPAVTGVSPSGGNPAGGGTVVISGTGLGGATAVHFGDVTLPSADFWIDFVGNINAIVPAHAVGQVHVTVTTDAGTSAETAADLYTYTTAPIVSGLTPSSGPVSGGTSVFISGANFTSSSTVRFGSTAATEVTYLDANTLAAIAPAGVVGTVDVIVTNADGSSPVSPFDQFTYTLAPSVTAISPTFGPLAGGTTVVLTGAQFTGATAVQFGGIPAASFTVDSATQITAHTPAATTTGPVTVTVTTPQGTSDLFLAPTFYYAGTPTVTGLSQSRGSIAGGGMLMIDGTDLFGVTAVNFGTTAVTTGISGSPDGTFLSVTVPAHAAGAVHVTVTSSLGTSAATAADLFTYTTDPIVSGLFPRSGPLAGGIPVTIMGENFTSASTVRFGSTLATSVTFVSSNELTAVSPAGVAGPVDVIVTTNGVSSVVVPESQFTYSLAPSVVSISPTQGPTAGGTTVTLTGAQFTADCTVTFYDWTGLSGTPATSVTFVSATQITAVTPAGLVGPASVIVSNTQGDSEAVPFTFISALAPVVTGLSPATGPTAGWNPVVISGTGLSNATMVLFDSSWASIQSTSPDGTAITVLAPPHAAGAVHVTVTTDNGTSSTSAADLYTYADPPPAVTGLSPASGSVGGGTTVTIRGTGMAGATAVRFGTTPGRILSAGSNQILVIAPAGVPGTVDITVTNANGTSITVPADQFTYTAAPVVNAVSPGWGPTTGGTRVTLTGEGFTGATEVRFGTTLATIVSNNGTQLVVLSPAASADGLVDITVTTPDGTSTLSAADQFLYLPPVVVTRTDDPSILPHAGRSLRDALGLANLNAAAGTSTLVVFASNLAGQTITLRQGQLELGVGGTGPGTIIIDGTSLARPVTVSGNNLSRVFQVDTGVKAVLDGIVITKGKVTGKGGGIHNEGNLTLLNVTVTGNTATNDSGGGLYNGGTMTIRNSAFTLNRSTGMSIAGFGGGGLANDGTMTVLASTINANTCANTGGGILSTGTLTLIASTISNNQNLSFGQGAGGVDVEAGQATLLNCTVSGNKAVNSHSAGGIGVYSGFMSGPASTVDLIDCTVSNNTASGQSGGALDAFGAVSLTGTILAGNFGGSGADIKGTTVTSGGYNLVGARTGSTLNAPFETPASVFGSTDQVGLYTARLNPRLAALANNGGPTATHALLAGSPALRKGSDVLATDQRGRIRATPADVGAFQLNILAPTVTSVAPSAGPVAGGTTVTITGANLTGITQVLFGTRPATRFSLLSPTQVTAVSPPAVIGTVDLRLVTPNGTSAVVAADRFTFAGVPRITRLAPASGPASGGTTVTITGVNLNTATQVLFGTTPATSFRVVSPTTITAVSPPTATLGVVDVQVTTAGGTTAVTTATRFTYGNSPAGAILTETPLFQWKAVTGATSYDLTVKNVTRPTTPPLTVTGLTDPSYQLTAGQALTPGNAYSWTVKAYTGSGTVAVGPTAFNVTALPAPVPIGPVGVRPAVAGYDRPTFSWGAVARASSYQLTVKAGTLLVFTVPVTGTSHTSTVALTPGRTYTWTVAAVSANGLGKTTSVVKTFTLAALPAPVLAAPVNGASLATGGSLTWNAVPAADHYRVKIVDAVTRAVVIDVPSTTALFYQLSGGLTAGRGYRWSVASVSASGTTVFSTERLFTFTG